MLHLPPPKTKLEVQLKYRVSNLNNQLKASRAEVLQPRIHKRGHIESGRKSEDAKRVGPTPMFSG